jgi:hypothetical protein
VLKRTCGEALALGNPLRFKVTLHEKCRDAPLTKLNRKREANWASTDDNHLISICHAEYSALHVSDIEIAF